MLNCYAVNMVQTSNQLDKITINDEPVKTSRLRVAFALSAVQGLYVTTVDINLYPLMCKCQT